MRWHRSRLPHTDNNNEEDAAGIVDDLARLYAPTEGPEQMARFESVLRERRQRQLNSEPQPQQRQKLSPKWGATGLAVVAMAIAAAVVAVALPSGGHSNGVANAQAFLAQIPQAPAVLPSQVLHQKREVYSRFGPMASEIASSSPIPTESWTTESWQEVGPDKLVVRAFGRTADGSGRVLQASQIEAGDPGVSRLTDVRTGAVLFDLNYQPVYIEYEGRTLADQFQAALENGTGRVVSQTDSDLVVEMREPIPFEVLARVEELRDQASVPYIWDLNPRETLLKVSFRADGVVLLTQQFVISESGNEVLVEEWRTVTHEVLSGWPVDIR